MHDLEKFEDNGVAYIIKDPEIYRNKKVLLAEGGDSALDWIIFLTAVASTVTLVHRRNEFRGALDSVEKVQQLKNEGKVNLITPAEVIALQGKSVLEKVTVKNRMPKQLSTSMSMILSPCSDFHPNWIP